MPVKGGPVKVKKIAEKVVTKNKLEARCNKCRVQVRPTNVELNVYKNVRKDGGKSWTFRIAGTCSKKKCGTSVSGMIGKEMGVKLYKS